MSIVNRYPNIRNIILQKNNLNISTHKKKWTIILFKSQSIDGYNNDELLKYFYELTIAAITKELLIEQIYICIYQNFENKQWFSNIIKLPNVISIIIPISFVSNSTKLSIIKKFIDEQKNIIFIEHGTGYFNINEDSKIIDAANQDSHTSTTLACLDNEQDIYSMFIDVGMQPYNKSDANIEEIYIPVMQKFNLKELIDPKMMIIPYSEQNASFMNNVFTMANELKTKNENFVTNISLTISSMRLNNHIKNIKEQNFGKNFMEINDRSTNSMIRELYVSNVNNPIEKEIIPYDYENYIFYPYMDIDSDKRRMINNYMDSTQKIRNEILNNATNENFPLPPIFNTNGFLIDVPKDKAVYPLMFKRFNDKSSGIFIKKENGEAVIPKIIHHIWLDEIPVKNYTNMWGRILKEPWQYYIWTNDNVMDILKNSRWIKIYEHINNNLTKKLIMYLAILEKYGGIIIDSYTIPLKMIPDELLTKRFMLSFADEKNSATKLSYRIVGSVAGYNNAETKIIAHGNLDFGESPISKTQVNPARGDPSRRPFEGANNFFRDVKQNRLNKPEIKKNTTRFPNIFDSLHKKLSEDGDNVNKLQHIENMLLADSNIAIYPSYYFNPSSYVFPKKLTNRAILINLWKPVNNPPINRTGIKRTYIINEKGIIAKLNENPIDRLKNSNKIVTK